MTGLFVFDTSWICRRKDRTGLRLSHWQGVGHQSGKVTLEREIEFYAVLQFVGTTNLRSGSLWWFRAVTDEKQVEYPMNHVALETVLANVEPQGVGLFDGRWRIKKHGGYASIVPVLADQS